jgi:hypothetical protein
MRDVNLFGIGHQRGNGFAPDSQFVLLNSHTSVPPIISKLELVQP